MLYDETCDFCRIGRNENDQAEVVCEEEGWLAFFPWEPATPGHTLVIPRVHVPDVWSLEAELGAELMKAVVRVGRAIQQATTPAGMNLISSSGEAAEQSVFHLHLHILPRYQADGIDIWPPKAPMSGRLEESVVNAIRDACGNA
jgi:histidine triad (HIT) family protein